MVDSGTVLGLAEESRPRVLVGAQAGLENLDGTESSFGVFRAVHDRGTALTNGLIELVSGDVPSGEVFLCHRSRRK